MFALFGETKPLTWALLLAVLFWLWPTLFGCTATLQGGKTTDIIVDTVKSYSEAATATTTLPGELVSDELAGKTFVVPARLGNVTTLRAWYPDGTPRLEVNTDPTQLWGPLFAAAGDYDYGKQQYDLQQGDAWRAFAQYLIAQLQPYGQAAMAEWQTTRQWRRDNPSARDASPLDKVLSELSNINSRLDSLEGRVTP